MFVVYTDSKMKFVTLVVQLLKSIAISTRIGRRFRLAQDSLGKQLNLAGVTLRNIAWAYKAVAEQAITLLALEKAFNGA